MNLEDCDLSVDPFPQAASLSAVAPHPLPFWLAAGLPSNWFLYLLEQIFP